MKKVSNKRYLLKKVFDYAGVAILLGILFFFWQLYRGPISAPFLKPYIIQALNYEENDQVIIDKVNIELVRSIRPLNITAVNVKYQNKDKNIEVTAPSVSLSFSIKALLRGMIAPSRVVVEQPKLSIFTTYGIDKGDEKAANEKVVKYYIEQFEEFVERFNSEEKIYPESYINDIVIKNAEVEFHEVDLGKKWSFSDLNYRFSRNFTNMELDINTLVNLQDRISAYGLNLKYKPTTNKLSFITYVSEAYFSDLLESILPKEVKDKIYNFDVPVNARFEGVINVAEIIKNKQNIANAVDTAVDNIHFTVEGGDGMVHFSDDKKMDYPVDNFMLSGEILSGLDNILIKNATFNIDGENIKILFSVSGLKKYFLEKSMENMKILLETDIDKFSLDKLSRYWPRYMGEAAWNWCKKSIYGGMAENVKFKFNFGYDSKTKSINFQNLSGVIDIKDSNISYFQELPDVKNFYGTAKFTNDSIYIKVDKGVADGVILNDGFVHLYDLGSEHNMIKIRLAGDASIQDALSFINHKPLLLADEIGLPVDKVSGNVSADLMLNFELKENLLPSEVNVKVTADLSDMKIKNIIADKSVSADKLELVVDNDGVKIVGQAFYEDIPTTINAYRRFNDQKYKGYYEVFFKIDNEIKNKLGVNADILGGDYIRGYTDMKAVVTVLKNDETYVEVSADLKNTEIDYDFLGFVKPIDEPATIYVKMQVKNNIVADVPEFKLSKNNFDLKGNIKIDQKTGQLKVVNITEIKGDKMNAKANIEFLKNPEKIVVNVSGYSYDLTTFFDKHDKQQEALAIQSNSEENLEENVPNMDIFMAVNNLWTNPDVPLKDFNGKAILRKGIGVHELHMAGNYGNNQAIKMKLDYIPKQNGEYMLYVDSNNAGTTLKVLRLYDYLQGGTLKIEARRDLNKEFFGHAQIRSFSIHNAPLAAKLFTVASFTGMVDLLMGEGISFSHFDAPFEYRNKTLYINKAKAVGNVLGMNGSGTLNRAKKSLNINGVISPAYSLNTMLGKIPVIGSLLSGKDGTVFAANYSIGGSFDNPNIQINPLSALSPNSIKELFKSIFGD